MSIIEKNRTLITCYFEEIWNQGKLQLLDEIIATNYINHSPGIRNELPGPAGLKPIIQTMRQAFPDLKYVIKDMVITDEKVAVYSKMHGTHLGDFFGLAATKKKVNVAQMQIEYISNNQIIEHWRITDDLMLMRQLGIMSE